MTPESLTESPLIQSLSQLDWEVLLEAVPEGVLLVDGQGRILHSNRECERIFRYEPGELTGQPVEALIPASLRGSHEVHRNRYAERPYNRPMGQPLETVGLGKDGSEVPVEICLSPLQTPHGVVVVTGVRDATFRRNAEQMLCAMATVDPLTGLPNKALILDRLQQSIGVARAYRRYAAMILLDLDHFKRINESFTHGGGDRILALVAERLAEVLPEDATLARMGGDEFAVVMRDLADVHEAPKTARLLLEALEEPFLLDEKEFVLTASAGISVYPHDGEDAESLVQNAETAMYRAKQVRNSYQHFAPDATSRAAERLALENSLRKAIEQDELLIHYQPQVSPEDGRIVGAEALIRWNHPDLGLVSPAQFIPLAEETGLIVPITEWVLEKASQQALDWQEAGLQPVRIAINLSARHLKHLELAETVRNLLSEKGLAPQQLDLELTESLLMENLDVAVELLEQLNGLNVRLSIDDFGTGYSSLSYLKRLPIQALKIDRTFIRDLDTDRSSEAIVRAIIDLAHHLDLKVVAEGVEEEQQLAQLAKLGCDEIQGFFYSRPVPAAQFADLLSQDPFRRQPLGAL